MLAPSKMLAQPQTFTSHEELAVPAALISSLRHQRDSERAAHARTLREADHEVASLHSRLALREAELEACVAHVDHASLLPPPRTVFSRCTKNTAPGPSNLSQLSPVSVTRALDDAIAVNDTLQAENDLLIREV
jgi:hypothetical protein